MEREDLKNEVLKGFHDQFAQNQNHHQRLFIQFLSAVLIVLFAYVVVITNITEEVQPIYTVKRHDYIISYSYFHLYGAYVIAQMIFVLLILVALNMGYNYRRDQTVNQNIRNYAINNNELIKNIFSTGGFDTKNLNAWDYLPGFHKIFYFFMLIVQILIWASVLFYIHFGYAYNTIIACLLFIPIPISMMLYLIYYSKYKSKIAC